MNMIDEVWARLSDWDLKNTISPTHLVVGPNTLNKIKREYMAIPEVDSDGFEVEHSTTYPSNGEIEDYFGLSLAISRDEDKVSLKVS